MRLSSHPLPHAAASSSPSFPALRPVALAILVLGMGTATLLPRSAIAQQAQTATQRSYDVPAGSLGDVLNRIGREAGVLVTYGAVVASSAQSAGVRGQFTVEQALAKALQGSGLVAVQAEDGGFVVRAAPKPAAAATAEDADQPLGADYTLREVRVTGKRDGETEGSGSYTTPAITIGKTAQALREHPQSVSVVTRQRLDDQNLTGLDGAAAQATGITVQDVNNRLSSMYSRGFEIDSVQLDGGAPMFVGLGFYTGTVFDMAEYDRVELLRGAAGLLNGTGNPGGAINLVRKMPTGKPQFNVEVSAGSWNNFRTQIDASGPLAFEGKVRGRAVISYLDREYFTDRRSTKKPMFYGVLETDLGPNAVLVVGAREERFKEHGSSGWVPRYSNGADLKLPRRSSGLTTDWAHTETTSKELFSKLTWRLADSWTLRVNATQAKQGASGLNAFGYGAVDPVTLQGHTWGGTPQQSMNKQNLLDVNLSGAFNFLGRTHEVLVGADIQDMTSQWLGTVFTDNPVGLPIDVFNPDPSLWEKPTTPVWVRDYNPNKQKQYGAYGTLRMEVADGTKIIVGARVNRFKYSQVYRERVDANDDFDFSADWSLASATSYSEPTKITPFAGVVYDIDNEWTAYASYAEIYKPQANLKAGPLPGSGLKPMRGSNVEIGLKGELMNGKLNTAFALYRIEQEGKAVRDPNYEFQTILYAGSCCYMGSGKVISQGFDVEVNGEVSRGVNVHAGYTYNNNQDKTTNAAFSTITPKHSVKLWGTWQLPDFASAWKIGGGATIQSKQYVKGTASSLNTTTGLYNGPSVPFNYTQSGYAVWNAMAEYRINPKWAVQMNLNNIFDKTYYRTMGSSASGNYYGEPRNVMLTVRGKF